MEQEKRELNQTKRVIKYITTGNYRIKKFNYTLQDLPYIQQEKIYKKVYLEAMKQDGYAIRFIKNPEEEVQLEAIRQNPASIQFIKNPTQKVQIQALQSNELLIKYIKKPSKLVQMEGIKQKSYYIKFIKNPCSDFITQAVKQGSGAITYIDNPSEDILKEHIRNHGLVYLKKNQIKSKQMIIDVLAILNNENNNFYKKIKTRQTVKELDKELRTHWKKN